MAEAIARERHGEPGLLFASAGTLGIPGRDMTTDAARALAEIDVPAHSGESQALDAELIHEADVIYTMEPHHSFWIINRWPEAEAKVHLLDAAGTPVEDPYGFPLAEYRRARDAIVAALEERAFEWA